ncbi:alpha/beta-hydrolase [Tothia fuscella]|uniref:Alpha/beta-hydrolase n=1 Tax=Tothia fuscella TaxID=1048955 RepID=A0A9P4NP28_9PEZI|nr:alpha/beta-hydrolase [Tothia fuscella]
MRVLISAVAAVLGLNGAFVHAVAHYKDLAPLKFEHPGELFSKLTSGACCAEGVVTSGNSTGTTKTIDGVSLYIAEPPNKQTDVAILYLTDIFGVQLVNNRLLGDSMAKAGYYVVMPDLFNGDPIPLDAMGGRIPAFDMAGWSRKHTTEMVDGIVASTIKTMRGQLGVKKIGAVGYCFGGKYVARFLAPGKGLDAGFTAHPSGVTVAEWSAISAPLSIAFGELDAANNVTQRAAAEAAFQRGNKTYQTNLYSGAEHGFAVRTDLSDRRKKFAQEGAFFQAVRWFDAWIK